MSDIPTAHHEAGHAVAAIVRRMPLRYVTLRPRNPGVVGRRVFRLGTCSDWDHAIQVHAGPLAVANHVWLTESRDVRIEEYSRCPSDVQALRGLLGDPGELWAESQQQAYDLLVGRWDSVTAVADALMERSTLQAAEVRALVA